MSLFTRIRQHKLVVSAFSVMAVALAIAVPALHADIARDNDANAILWGGAATIQEWTTKYTNGDGHNNVAATQKIYKDFGIDATSFAAVTEGTVTKSGNVIVNGNVVASNVWTAGRQNIGNSVPMFGVYMRPPSVSFQSASLPAFVNMTGGKFNYAVVKSCGNPVFSIDKPYGQIYKRVITSDGVSHAADDVATAIAFKTGDTFKYEITVTNNGTTSMNNVKVTDTLPAGVELVSNPAKRDFNLDFGNIAANDLHFYTLTMKVTATSGTITNKACFTADSNQSGCDDAVITVTSPTPTPTPTPTSTPTPTPTPTPSSFACGGLTATQQGGSDSLTYEFKVNTQLTNVDESTVSYTYDFGDNATLHTTKATVSHTYAQAGNYKATVIVITPKGQTTLTPDCMVSFHAGPTKKPICETTPSASGCGGGTPTTTTKLPDTGAEGLAGMGGLGVIGFGIREYVRSKKSLLTALKK